MALVGRPERIPVPHEPGEWFEVRRLSSLALAERPDLDFPDLATFADDRERAVAKVRFAFRWILACVTAWSYRDEAGDPVPLTSESVELLDDGTTSWAFGVAFRRTKGIETATEKNVDSPGSSDSSTALPAAPVPTNG